MRSWSQTHLLELFVYNLVLLLLVLLHSAGYFSPYFPITINLIFFVSLVLASLLLSLRSVTMFIIAVAFSLFALILLVVGIRIWADRTMIYVFQSFFLGGVLLFLEEIRIIKK